MQIGPYPANGVADHSPSDLTEPGTIKIPQIYDVGAHRDILAPVARSAGSANLRLGERPPGCGSALRGVHRPGAPAIATAAAGWHRQRAKAKLRLCISWEERPMLVMDVIAEILKREGISTLFCFPTTPIIEAAAAAGIKPVICRQERVGVHMADGFARVSNGRPPGVFAMQYGPCAEYAFA